MFPGVSISHHVSLFSQAQIGITRITVSFSKLAAEIRERLEEFDGCWSGSSMRRYHVVGQRFTLYPGTTRIAHLGEPSGAGCEFLPHDVGREDVEGR